MTHNDILSSSAESLGDIILDSFVAYTNYYRGLRAEIEDVSLFATWKKNLGMLLAEQSYALIEFWKYEQCEEAILEGLDLVGLDLNLDGKLGRRTKWQAFDLAQLVLDVKSKEVVVKTAKPANDDADNGKSDLYVV